MTLNIFIVIYLLFLPFIMMFKSLTFGDSPGFSSTSIASCSHVAAILDSGKFHFFSAHYLSFKSKILHHHRVQREKLPLEKLFSATNVQILFKKI